MSFLVRHPSWSDWPFRACPGAFPVDNLFPSEPNYAPLPVTPKRPLPRGTQTDPHPLPDRNWTYRRDSPLIFRNPSLQPANAEPEAQARPRVLESTTPLPSEEAPLPNTEQSGSMNARDVHDKLRNMLRKPLAPTDGSKLDYIYILRELHAPHHLKIGHSQDHCERKRSLGYTCDKRFETIWTSPYLDVYLRTESLIHLDLAQYNQRFCCSKPKCRKKSHKEYFDVDDDTAIQTVKRWVEFMQLQPYNSSGNLKDVWVDVLGKRDAEAKGARGEELGSHQLRWQLWGAMIERLSWKDCILWAFGSFFKHLDPVLWFLNQFRAELYPVVCFYAHRFRDCLWWATCFIGVFFFMISVVKVLRRTKKK